MIYFSYIVIIDNWWLKLCSVIGASIIGMGYYTILCGEFKRDEEKSCACDESSDSFDKKIPLLQEKMEV